MTTFSLQRGHHRCLKLLNLGSCRALTLVPLSKLLLSCKFSISDRQSFRLEWQALLLQHVGPLLCDLGKARRRVSLSEKGCFTHPLCLDQHVQTTIDVGQQVSRFECHVVLSGFLGARSQLLKALLITITAVEKQQTIEIVALVKAVLSQGELTSGQSNITNFAPLIGCVLRRCDLVSILNQVQ